MTEKNIFAYKLYLSLNISNFNSFFMRKLQPPEKIHHPLSQQPPSKSWSLVKPHLFENLVGGDYDSPQSSTSFHNHITRWILLQGLKKWGLAGPSERSPGEWQLLGSQSRIIIHLLLLWPIWSLFCFLIRW